MTAAGTRSAAVRQMARHRAEMQLALREGLSLAEARDRLSRERWMQADRRLEERKRRAEAEAPTPRPRLWWLD